MCWKVWLGSFWDTSALKYVRATLGTYISSNFLCISHFLPKESIYRNWDAIHPHRMFVHKIQASKDGVSVYESRKMSTSWHSAVGLRYEVQILLFVSIAQLQPGNVLILVSFMKQLPSFDRKKVAQFHKILTQRNINNPRYVLLCHEKLYKTKTCFYF